MTSTGRARAEQVRPARAADRWRRRRHRLTVLAAVGVGGGLGSVARALVSHAVAAPPTGFPWGTFLINVTGCFALGVLMVFVLQVWPPTRYVRPFLGVGFLGGYTTFSTFAVEIVTLAKHGQWAVADAYALDSLLAGLIATWGGIALTRKLTG